MSICTNDKCLAKQVGLNLGSLNDCVESLSRCSAEYPCGFYGDKIAYYDDEDNIRVKSLNKDSVIVPTFNLECSIEANVDSTIAPEKRTKYNIACITQAFELMIFNMISRIHMENDLRIDTNQIVIPIKHLPEIRLREGKHNIVYGEMELGLAVFIKDEVCHQCGK